VIGATVDPQLVPELGLDGSDQSHHGTPESGREGTDAADAALLHQIEEGVGFAKAETRPEEALPPEPRPPLDVEELGAGGREGARPAAEHRGGDHPSILVSPTFPDRAGEVTIRPPTVRWGKRRSPRATPREPAAGRRDQEAADASTG
jgi:hypothetical protein